MNNLPPIVETAVHIRNPITKNGSVYVIGYGVSFANTGETMALIDGVKRIAPGTTWMIGHGELHAVFAQRFIVKFEGDGENYLEVEEHQLKECDYSNYEKQ
ncbi:MAG: hypothetical protein AAFY91_10875 [Bacteroidota bacterium]